ncbi:Trypsin, Ehrlichia rpt, Ldl recept a, SEA and/or FXa inhibition domain containing protein [Asbolus verrucosus]|uniref:Trypsin, Ehrlichia rpt, Ldl recept a, SEA and/or FXa inhibition domain containing protein n=1 Tax=Asbolus verrucosus TaxID=1661398 RepID=A0A482VN50_ASBVE|nr:Trypsin, Ehrlichia rpt, Ldl recept a, SEA and/or FXa inhibition domain containing protein [Asbolus verrucosus]
MDADSSYGGSDTAQDSHSGHDNSSSLETTHNDVSQQQEPNSFYHKNEITLPVNYDETDYQDKPAKQPHYMSTANLNINDTLEHHSNLEEMSKNYKSTSYLNESPKARKKSDAGVDNPAFQEEEYKPEVKSTFDNNKPYNGDLNSSTILGLTSPNKNEEPLTEAVNLELINLKPVGKDVTGAYENGTNGMTSIPVKKENDAEIGNPYDEYFVPVNEHRKYMRGEKLYVTMDKRNKKKRNKCLCWGLCLCIVAAAVIIGILAAVGVIGNQGPQPVQEASARHFGGSTNEPEVKAGGIFGLPKGITDETTIPPEMQTQPVVTKTSVVRDEVPRALESQLVIDNLVFTPALADKNSTEFKELASTLETELKHSLFSSDVLNFGAADIEVKVIDFTSGSVVVKYRITWVFKEGIHAPKDPINEEMLKRRMRNVLDQNNEFIDNYHIVGNTVTVDRIRDLCKVENNNGCEYNCSFDYKLADFICSCPEGKYLDHDQKSCIDELIIEPETPDFGHNNFPEPHHDTTVPPFEPEPTTQYQYHHHEVTPEPKPEPEPEPTAEPAPEPTAEPPASPEPEPTHPPQETSHANYKAEVEATPEPNVAPVTELHFHSELGVEPNAEPTAEPTAEPNAEPTPEPAVLHNLEIDAKTEHDTEPVAEPTTEPPKVFVMNTNTEHIVVPTIKPDVEHNTEPIAEPTTEPVVEHNTESVAEPTVEPIIEHNTEPVTGPAFEHNFEPKAEPVSESNTEPAAEPTAEPTSEHNTEPVAEPTAEPTIEHNTEPVAEPASEHNTEPLTEPKAVHISEHSTEPIVEPTAEPTSEPISEPTAEPVSEHNTDRLREPKLEPISEHTTEPFAQPTAEPISEHNTEPLPQPIAESVSEHNTEPVAEPTAEPVSEHNTEPSAEPTAEPVSEHNTEPSAEPKVEPASEHSTEPLAEPTAEPISEHNTEPLPQPKVESASEHNTEPAAEPSAEPVIEHSTEPSAEPKAEPAAEHSTEPTAVATSEHNTEPVAEPTSQPVTERIMEHVIHDIHPVEGVAVEYSTEHVAESTVEPHVESKTMTESASENKTELNIEPNPLNQLEPINKADNQEETTTAVNEANTEPVAEPTAEPSSEPAVESSPSSSEHLTIETTTKSNYQIPVFVSSSEIIAESVTTMSPLTSSTEAKLHLEENEFRTNHLSSEIFAEPETTTMTDKEMLVTTTESNDNNSVETSETNNIFNSEIRSEGSPITTNVTPAIDDAANTIQPEMTTLPTVTETTIKKDDDNGNLISVAVNENTHFVKPQSSSESSENNTTTIPFMFNNQPVVVETGHVEIRNESSEPKIYEITTKPSELNKLSDHSSEINNTHLNIAIVESTENTSAMDNMSPFLPEIDNDTFVNKLHLGEHIIPPIQNDTHEDEVVETSPPRLDNDQMNYTNPQDSNPVDTSLKVIPLEGTENEILNKIVSTEEPRTETETHAAPGVPSQEETVTTTLSSARSLDNSEENSTELRASDGMKIVHDTLSVASETTTKSSEEIVKTTLPSEIINNVHSNNYFENLEVNHEMTLKEVEKENETVPTEQQNHLKDFSTSTEDLIALETTTNGIKVAENRIGVVENTTQPSPVNETITIHAEIMDTVTESVNFETNSTDSNSTLVNDINNVNISTATISTEVTTMPPPNQTSHQYEVQEAVSDVTTTEKLFLITKATTASPIITKADYEDLSVVPLNADEEEEQTSKVNEKRVAPDTTLNQLESETSDSTNDISQEDATVLDKFHHNLNEISVGSEKSVDSTTSKSEELDSNTELTKYDEIKSNKKNYLDKEKLKFDKKVKLEKAITTVTDDEILTTSIPSDRHSNPFSDIKPVTEGFVISGFTRCSFGEFQCVNGTSTKDGSYCISETDRCDSVNDCSDASDEIDCVKDGCPNNFQCASGQCLKRHLVCDGIQNCNDGTDEVGCDHWSCRPDEFSCGQNQRCLPMTWRCDNRRHCVDGSDEFNCQLSVCSEDSFHCTEQNTCVPKSWKCDGQSDCLNSEDEKSCECANDEFKCAIGGGCVKNEQRCDGVVHCADRSDEWNCFRLEEEISSKKYLQIETGNNTWYPVCSENWNQTHSDLVCRNLGYGASSLTETVKKSDGDFKGYFKLKSELTYGSPILSQVEKTDDCDSFTSITCQDFAPLWVIASHSCVFDTNLNLVQPNDWILYAGSTNFFGNADNSTTQVKDVKNILSHPQAKYSQFEFDNDVVLVELMKPLTMTRNVSAVCLPDKDIEPRQLCVIAGWGVSKPGEPNRNQYLHYLPVPVIDTEECNSTKHYNGLMSKDKICAGYTDSEKTPCYNDEGAPLMCFSESAGSTWELQGVLSHHDNCARSKHPAIYTAINAKIRKWVINTIGQQPARSA